MSRYSWKITEPLTIGVNLVDSRVIDIPIADVVKSMTRHEVISLMKECDNALMSLPWGNHEIKNNEQ